MPTSKLFQQKQKNKPEFTWVESDRFCKIFNCLDIIAAVRQAVPSN